jgi:hypothetical protein
LHLSLLEQMPFTIASAHEFETAIQIVAEIGISKVMAAKSQGEYRTWGLVAFLQATFASEITRVNWAGFTRINARSPMVKRWANSLDIVPARRMRRRQ